MKKLAYIMGFALLALTSCKKELQDPGTTKAAEMANEWWVELKLNGTDIYHLDHFKLSTYNTAADNNQIWVDDLKNGYGFKTKVNADFGAKTFSGNTLANLYYNAQAPTLFPQTVNITEGKVLRNAGHSKTGNVTDSIFMKVEFSDDPGTIYTLSGTARTKYLEDDY